MASLNQCNFSGVVGQDPEVKYLESGKVVANLSIAVKGYRPEDDFWVNLKAWGKQAELIANYVKKGSRIIVSARMGEEKWTDRESGKERKKSAFTINDIMLLDKREGGNSGAQASSRRAPARSSRPPAAQQERPAPEEEEIPF
jgi:single-strand DNA-binding protein